MGERRRAAPKDNALAGLSGGGPSIVGVTGAMRARDAARPRPEDERRAERSVVVRRGDYAPPDRRS